MWLVRLFLSPYENASFQSKPSLFVPATEQRYESRGFATEKNPKSSIINRKDVWNISGILPCNLPLKLIPSLILGMVRQSNKHFLRRTLVKCQHLSFFLLHSPPLWVKDILQNA